MIQEQQVSPLPKVNGAKFVVWFIVAATVTSVVFCYAIYNSYMTRPIVKIEEEK